MGQCRVGSCCCSTMCVVNSFFGIPLQTAVKWIGIFKLVITLILAITCIVGQTQVTCTDDKGNLLDGGSIECVGPYIRQICFDFFLPMTCALLLIFGARQNSSCLLLSLDILELLLCMLHRPHTLNRILHIPTYTDRLHLPKIVFLLLLKICRWMRICAI